MPVPTRKEDSRQPTRETPIHQFHSCELLPERPARPLDVAALHRYSPNPARFAGRPASGDEHASDHGPDARSAAAVLQRPHACFAPPPRTQGGATALLLSPMSRRADPRQRDPRLSWAHDARPTCALLEIGARGCLVRPRDTGGRACGHRTRHRPRIRAPVSTRLTLASGIWPPLVPDARYQRIAIVGNPRLVGAAKASSRALSSRALHKQARQASVRWDENAASRFTNEGHAGDELDQEVRLLLLIPQGPKR
jgi:hypothetical protein